MSKATSSFLEHIQISLFLSVLAVATNLFLKVDAVGDSQLLFGASFVYLGMLILPLVYVLPIALASFASLAMQDIWPVLMILFAIEFIIIRLFLSLGVILLLSSLLFWVVIGTPAVWYIHHLYVSDLPGTNTVLTLNIVFNAVLNASIASTLYALLPKAMASSKIPKQHRLSTNIFSICASTLVLPLLISTYFFITHSVYSTQVTIRDKLADTARIISLYTDNYMLKHQMIIEQLANSASANIPLKDYEKVILKTQAKHPSFFNIGMADNEGNLMFFAPAEIDQIVSEFPKERLSVAHREYFQKARDLNETFVSQGLVSNGILRAAIVAIASPISQLDSFSGLVFGVINLSTINALTINIEDISQNHTIIVTDKNNKLLFSNATTINYILEPFDYDKKQSKLLSEAPILEYEEHQFIFGESLNQFGWHIYVLDEGSTVSKSIQQQFVYVAFGLLLIFLFFMLFAYRLSNRITAPLVSLLKNDDEFSTDQLQAPTTSREISDMARKLKRSNYLMRNFEDRLKLQVEEKTTQLEQLNVELAAQARNDALTGLYNRAGFSELANKAMQANYRLEQPFSVVILDIDYFKNINDSYGHPIGDKCLIAFAELMRCYCQRETDTIGRHGGEEFIIYMWGVDIASQHEIINTIHEQTRFIKVFDDNTQQYINFTVSIGVCTVRGPAKLSLEQLITLADEELYRCKRAGRDRVSINVIDA